MVAERTKMTICKSTTSPPPPSRSSLPPALSPSTSMSPPESTLLTEEWASIYKVAKGSHSYLPGPEQTPSPGGEGPSNSSSSSAANSSSGSRVDSGSNSIEHIDESLQTSLTLPSYSSLFFKSLAEFPEPVQLPPEIDISDPYVSGLSSKEIPFVDPEGSYDRYLPPFGYDGWSVATGRPFIICLRRVHPIDRQGGQMYGDKLRYQIEEVIGKGGFGTCYLLRSVRPDHDSDGSAESDSESDSDSEDYPSRLVMKVPFLDAFKSPPTLSILRELAISRWLADPRVSSEIKGAFTPFYNFEALSAGLSYALFMAFMPGGELRGEINKQRYVEPNHNLAYGYLREELDLAPIDDSCSRRSVAIKGKNTGVLKARVERCFELVKKIDIMNQAFELMFGERVYHSDIKPDNILIDHQGKLRISDLGFIMAAKDIHRGSVPGGTAYYQPTEVSVRLKLMYSKKLPDGGMDSERWMDWIAEYSEIQDHMDLPIGEDFYVWAVGVTLLQILHPALLLSPWYCRSNFGQTLIGQHQMATELHSFLEKNLRIELPSEPPRRPIHAVHDAIGGCFLLPGERIDMPSLAEKLEQALRVRVQADLRSSVPVKGSLKLIPNFEHVDFKKKESNKKANGRVEFDEIVVRQAKSRKSSM
ncbi:hypothetical protein IAT40_000652 [Kwoniella sp. CBS 6097]